VCYYWGDMGSTPFLTPVFLFGSIRGGSGKSSIVAHLSVYLQSKSRRVAVIDANAPFPNLFRSVLPRSVSLECYTDLTDLVVEGSSRFRRTFVFTATDKISYFPAFKLKDPVRLLSDASLRDFFLQLRSHFDVVLINLPPGCDNFVVAETFLQRRGNDAGAPAAVLVTTTDVRSLALLDSMLRSRPALFHFARERLMFVYNMLPRGIEDTTIERARLNWNETRRLFRLPISLGISMIDEFEAQAKAALPLVTQESSLIRQTMATLSRTLSDVAEGQWQGDPPKGEADEFAPCLDSFLLERLNRHIEPLQNILARRLCTHGAIISSFIESSASAYRFRLRLSGIGRRSLPPILDLHFPAFKTERGGRIPPRFTLDPEFAPPPESALEQEERPSISAKPLYHFDDRFASRCRFDIFSETSFSWLDAMSDRNPEWRGYIAPSDLPSLTRLLGFQKNLRKQDAFLFQRIEFAPEIRPSLISTEFNLCTSFSCRAAFPWLFDDRLRAAPASVGHVALDIPSREALSVPAGPDAYLELPGFVRTNLALIASIVPKSEDEDRVTRQIRAGIHPRRELAPSAPPQPRSYPPETRACATPELTPFEARRSSFALRLGVLLADFSALPHDTSFLTDEICAGFEKFQTDAAFQIRLRRRKRLAFPSTSPLPGELALGSIPTPSRNLPIAPGLGLSLPQTFGIDSDSIHARDSAPLPEFIGRLFFEPSLQRAVPIPPPPFRLPRRFGMAPFLIELTLPRIAWGDLPYRVAVQETSSRPSPASLDFAAGLEIYDYLFKQGISGISLLKRPPSISVFFKPMTWSFRNLEYAPVTRRPFDTRSVFPAAWSPGKIAQYAGFQRLQSGSFAVIDVDCTDHVKLLRLPFLQLLAPSAPTNAASWVYGTVDVAPVRDPAVPSECEFWNLYEPDNQFPLPDFGKRPGLVSSGPIVSTAMPPLSTPNPGLCIFAFDIREFAPPGYQPPETAISILSEPYTILTTLPSCLEPVSPRRPLSIGERWLLVRAAAWNDSATRIRLLEHMPARLKSPTLDIIKPYSRPALPLPPVSPEPTCAQPPMPPRTDFRKPYRHPDPAILFTPASPGPLLKKVFPLELLARRSKLPYSMVSGIDMLYACLMDRARRSLYGPIEHRQTKIVQPPRFWRDTLAVSNPPKKASAHDIDVFFSCPDRIHEKIVRRQAILGSRVTGLLEAIKLTQASVDRLSSSTPS